MFNEEKVSDIMNLAIQKMREKNLEALGTEQLLEALIEKNSISLLNEENITLQKVQETFNQFQNRKLEFIEKNIFL